MRNHVTIKDIARDLGLSYATVSLALNDAPGVNSETRRRVKEFAREVRYLPNASARAITTGRSSLVGALLGRFTESFYEEVMQGIENAAARGGYDVIASTTGSPNRSERDTVERLIGRRVDGVIATPVSISAQSLDRLTGVGIPVLLLRPDAAGECPYVAVDHLLGGRLAGGHLADLGHQRVLYIGDRSVYSGLRAEGAKLELERRGASLASHDVEDALDTEDAYRFMQARLKEPVDFTAVFCAADMLGFGVCRALHEAGIAVPETVSVMGYDDLKWAKLFSPPLTTIHQPQISQGETAMEMLIQLIEGKTPHSRVLSPRLVVRNSTGPAKIGAPLRADFCAVSGVRSATTGE